ncbi:MAG: nucleotidyltransferase domain-containing protein [Armatimonadetes bacterium]|nr:nucleotidyltransferase domain-containing protein [Armatimonadota bacterium]
MVPRQEIQAFAQRVAEEFQPQRIILFGSHARDEATRDSDVDLLVIMPHEGSGWRTAASIRARLRPSFPLDLLVRSPAELEQRLRLGDEFMRDIVTRGQVLYELLDERVDR